MENRYVSVKKSKSGNINKKNVAIVATVATIFGVIGIGSILSSKKAKEYIYDDSFKSYASQIEYNNDVDLSPEVEESLNQLQDITVSINQYKNSEDDKLKEEAWEILSESEYKVQKSTLDAVKEVAADNYGGNPGKMKTYFERGDGEWMITNVENGPETLTGKSRDAVVAVANSQYDKDMDNLSQKEKEDYVDDLNDMIKAQVDLRVSEAPKK